MNSKERLLWDRAIQYAQDAVREAGWSACRVKLALPGGYEASAAFYAWKAACSALRAVWDLVPNEVDRMRVPHDEPEAFIRGTYNPDTDTE